MCNNKVGILVLSSYLALLAGSGADLTTTLYTLKNISGTSEANPVLSHGTGELVVVKLASTAVLAWAMKRFDDSGHHTVARVLGFGAGVGFAGLAIHNMKVGR